MMQKHIKGFTILELMVVVAVIGILAAIAVPQYQNYIKKSQFAEVINMTSAIKISDALCMKEYNQKIGCSGGTNNVVADITAINKTKYTLSVVTQDGVITATARGPNDAAAIAAAGGPIGGAYPTSVAQITTMTQTCRGSLNLNTARCIQAATDVAVAALYANPAIIALSQNYSGFTGFMFVGTPLPRTDLNFGPGAYYFPYYYTCCGFIGYDTVWMPVNTPTLSCPNPPTGPAYTLNVVNGMCERPPNPNPAPATPPASSLNNETYILNPTIDVSGKITYTVGGTCIATGLCQAN